jgi:hypothetical protein
MFHVKHRKEGEARARVLGEVESGGVFHVKHSYRNMKRAPFIQVFPTFTSPKPQ